MIRIPLSTTIIILLLALQGCSDDGPAGDGDAAPILDTSTLRDVSVGDETHVPDTTLPIDALADTTSLGDSEVFCDHTGYSAVAEDASYLSTYGVFLYLAQDTLGEPVTTLNMELKESGGASKAGTYTITDANYSTCVNCITIHLDCDGALSHCAKAFLAREGALTISSFGTTGGSFTGTLTDVVLSEVTIDANFVSTLVPNGETWCLPSYSFDTTVQ